LERVPVEISGWRSASLPTDDKTAAILDADVTLKRSYERGDGTSVGLFVAYFAQQQVNSQIHSPRNCLPGAGWKVRRIREEVVPVNGGPQPVTCMVMAHAGAEQEVLYWFRTRTGDITGEYAMKWDLVKNSLARRRTDAVLIRYDGSHADSSAIRDLMGLLNPRIRTVLAGIGM
jgi:EpsI family protein